jgi:hypothetical protein
MKLVIVTAIDGRRAAGWMLQSLAAQRLRLAAELDFSVVATVSMGAIESRMPDLQACDARWFPWPDKPLSEKWQAAVNMARLVHPDLDAIGIIGADDYIGDGWWRTAAEAVAAGASAVGPDRLWIANSVLSRAFQLVARIAPHTYEKMPLGPGRVISRKALGAAGWVLWPEPKARGLDGAAWRRLRSLGIHMQMIGIEGRPDCLILDRKGDGENLNPYDTLAPAAVAIAEGPAVAAMLAAAGAAA